MCTTAAAFEIVDSSNINTCADDVSAFGELYRSGMHGTEVARELRADFKRAQKFGAFKGVKVSITSSSYSMGSSVTVKILAAPFSTLDPRKVVANIRRGNAYETESARATLLRKQIEMMANLYRRDDSDPRTDYFNCNCYLNVSVEIDTAEERRGVHARVAGASLAHVLAAANASAPLADDRPSLAVSALTRGDYRAAREIAAEGIEEGGEGDLCRAVVAVVATIERDSYGCDNAFRAARPAVLRVLSARLRDDAFAVSVYDAAYNAPA